MKDNENHKDLLKVPDAVIIKELRIDLGKANSYISELEFKLKAQRKENTVIEKESKYKEHIKGLETANRKLKLHNQTLSFKNNELLTRIKKYIRES